MLKVWCNCGVALIIKTRLGNANFFVTISTYCSINSDHFVWVIHFFSGLKLQSSMLEVVLSGALEPGQTYIFNIPLRFDDPTLVRPSFQGIFCMKEEMFPGEPVSMRSVKLTTLIALLIVRMIEFSMNLRSIAFPLYIHCWVACSIYKGF